MKCGAIFSGYDARDYKLVCAAREYDFPKEFELKTVRVKNQDTVGSCHDKETEVLTRDGWKFFKDITYDDYLASVEPNTGDFIFEKPTNIIKEKYSGEMIVGKHRSMDFMVTPNHKMVVRKWVESKRKLDTEYQFIDADKLGWWVGFRTDFYQNRENSPNIVLEEERVANGNILPRMEITMDDWVQLLGIYLAEGTMYKDVKKHHYRFQLAAVKRREKEYIRELLNRIGIIGINEQKDRFHFHNKRIWKKFEEYGLLGVKSYDKFVPDFIFELDAEYIRKFLYGFAMGDGCFAKNGTVDFYTSSIKMAEQIQMLLLMSGTYSKIYIRKPEDVKKTRIIRGREIHQKHNSYAITSWKTNSLTLTKKKDLSIAFYDDYVYCAEVPTYHTLITRRNGNILLSGNCVAHSLSSILEYYNNKQNDNPTEMSVGYIYGNRSTSEYKGEGMIMRDALEAVRKCGDVYRSDFCKGIVDNIEVPEATLLYEMQKNALHDKAYPHRISQYCRVNSVNAIKASLYAGNPVLMAMMWYDDMEVVDGVLTTSYVGEAGGHCMFIYGWNETGWLIQNSWGEEYGVNGCFVLPYEMPVEEFWTLTDDIIEGTYVKRPFKSRVGKIFAKVINKIANKVGG